MRENCDVWENESGERYYVKKNESFELNNCFGISYRWKSERDLGPVDAVRKGFQASDGSIFCWLNSDDYYAHEDVLERVTYYFESDPKLQLLFGDGIFVSRNGEQLGVHHVDDIDLYELLYLDYHILQPSTFFTKEIYEDRFLDNRFTCAYDAHFFIRLLKNDVGYKKVDDVFGVYRYYEANRTISLSKKKYKESMEIAWEYSKNVYFYAISAAYRKAENILHPVVVTKRGLKYKLFVLIRRICYFLITGKFGR